MVLFVSRMILKNLLKSVYLYLRDTWVSLYQLLKHFACLDKPRLLKLSFSTTQEKVLVFKLKSKLRSKDNPEHVRRLFITSDLTPFEQKQNKALRQQLADMNKVENVYKIKNGSIVRRS